MFDTRCRASVERGLRPVGSGLKDLILMPSHSALTIHEIRDL